MSKMGISPGEICVQDKKKTTLVPVDNTNRD
jgi:hypothetical protein